MGVYVYGRTRKRIRAEPYVVGAKARNHLESNPVSITNFNIKFRAHRRK